MFRSIRWRLIASHVSLAVLTVSVAGLLALWGVRHTAQQQEISYLTVTAESLAEQALPLMSPEVDPVTLSRLVETTAFFNNVQVRIVDAYMSPLVDSGDPLGVGEVTWFALPEEVDQEVAEELRENGWFMKLLPHEGGIAFYDSPTQVTVARTNGKPVTIIRRAEGHWREHFTIEQIQPEFLEYADAHISAPEAFIVRTQKPVSAPIGQMDAPLGYVQLSAVSDFGAEALAFTWRAFLVASAGAVLLAIALGMVMGRRLSAPISELTETSRQMSSGDLSARARVRGRDEIGELASQFNHMAGQLQASFAQVAGERDALRRFIADASHELRTPITALNNFVTLLQGAAAEDLQARAEFLGESQTQLERLSWITENLLNLSRLDAGLIALEIEAHDLDELLESAMAPYKRLAGEKSIQLSLALPPEPVEIRCDRPHVEMALSNLLDNALKFTGQGGAVEVSAEVGENEIYIHVSDNGPGIHPDDLPHVFERFYRGRNASHAGSGLGLAIVQSVVNAHGGHLTVDSQPDHGARFTINLPTL